MKDAKTLAYINLFAVLGAIPYLCDLDKEAAELIKGKSVSVGFAVKDGPEATLFFGSGKCRMAPGVDRCQVKLPFSSCEKFHGLIDGTVTPIPSKGFTKIGFLTGPFTKLTDRLTMFLKPDPAALEDPEFFRVSTTLMFHVIAEAIAQIANHDKVGMFSASNIVDGTAKLCPLPAAPPPPCAAGTTASRRSIRLPQSIFPTWNFRTWPWPAPCLTAT